jgi:hypothetical protein
MWASCLQFLSVVITIRAPNPNGNNACNHSGPMDIHVVSTLTMEDEDRVADALVAALAELLDGLPIAYALRIETSGAKIVQRTNLEATDPTDPLGVSSQTVQ